MPCEVIRKLLPIWMWIPFVREMDSSMSKSENKEVNDCKCAFHFSANSIQGGTYGTVELITPRTTVAFKQNRGWPTKCRDATRRQCQMLRLNLTVYTFNINPLGLATPHITILLLPEIIEHRVKDCLFKLWRLEFLLFRSFNDVTSLTPQNRKINFIPPPNILSRKKRNRRSTATGNNEDWVTING